MNAGSDKNKAIFIYPEANGAISHKIKKGARQAEILVINNCIEPMLYKFFLIGVFCLRLHQCYAQSVVQGKLKFDDSFGRFYPVKVVLSNNERADTVVIDSTFRFHFHKITAGKYQLQILTNYGATGLKNIVVTNLEVSRDSVKLPEITLFKGTACEGGSRFSGIKKGVEFYKSGELYAKGKYKIKKQYDLYTKTFWLYYEKEGIWNYYYKSGNLLREGFYVNDNLISFKDYYENKNLKLIGHYDDCKANIWKFYAENGHIVFAVDFKTPFLMTIDSEFLAGFMKNYTVLNDL